MTVDRRERALRARAQGEEGKLALGERGYFAEDDQLGRLGARETLTFTPDGIRRDYACAHCGLSGGH